MPSLTYYARGDSSSANNSALNAQGTNTTPTTTLVFDSDPTGDLVLDYNGGAADPDTYVLVDGVQMNFTLEFTGTLPVSNKLSNVNGEDLRGEEIAIITTEDGQRYFFLTNGTTSFATMDAFPNGAHAIENVDTTSGVMVCFLRGTLIETPDGPVPVERLRVGDSVLTAQGKIAPIRFCSSRRLTFTDLALRPDLRPVCIPANHFGPGRPFSDLWLSPQHCILFSGWEAELLFEDDNVLVPAKFLAATSGFPQDGVEYFHVLLDRHDIIVSNGLETESMFPGDMALASLGNCDRTKLKLAVHEIESCGWRFEKTAYRTLRRHEGAVLRWFLAPRQTGLMTFSREMAAA